MQRTVLNRLERDGKGIILFHDIQMSTARGIKELLAELQSRGFRVVHIVPSKPATTLPEFDAMAAKSTKGRNGATATAPLADRAVTWPVAGDAAPSERRQAPSSPPAARKTAPAVKDWSNPDTDPCQLRSMGH